MSKKASRSDFRWLLPPDLATVYVPPFSFSWGISHLVVIPCHSHFFPPKNCVKFNQEFASMKIEIQNNPLQERKDWRTLKNPTPWTGQVFTSGAPPKCHDDLDTPSLPRPPCARQSGNFEVDVQESGTNERWRPGYPCLLRGLKVFQGTPCFSKKHPHVIHCNCTLFCHLMAS